ncbi:hypothetical protein LEN26_011071 [Aphanomyces euteiches]|nr:hypothetical protein AeMF1_011606 [Aphanomyces euteiches]KAH9120514.1 hypothetical protein LEN26_011071 [Aphanomyces euteiches]KAH9191691.1 hypothetical protein AeNC1_006337 [Aphanomyces euteiches]
MVAVAVSEDEKRIEKEFLANRPPLAYAKLQGLLNETEPFEAVITQLPVELGRGTDPSNGKICLGEQMSVSRVHARITWNTEKACFEIECLGKNGLFAGGRVVTKDSIVQLTPKMPVKIGSTRFYFLPAVKSQCGVMSGFKMIQKAFEKAQPAASTTGLTVEDTIEAVYKCFRDIDYEVGGRDNLASLIKGYFEYSPANFKRVSITATGEPRYVLIKPEKTDDDKKRPPTAPAVPDAKKKQKVDITPAASAPSPTPLVTSSPDEVQIIE